MKAATSGSLDQASVSGLWGLGRLKCACGEVRDGLWISLLLRGTKHPIT